MSEVNMSAVAERANVSVATVSRAISGTAPVSKATKAKIHRVMKELGYVPKGKAASRNQSKVKTVALVLALATKSLESDFFFLRLIEGIHEELESNEIRLLVSTLKNQAFPADEISADGLIIGGPIQRDDFLTEAIRLGTPLVAFDRYQHAHVPSVLVDNVEAGRIVVKHLSSLGHARIGAVAGPKGIPPVDDKLEGYEMELRTLGLPFDEGLVVRSRQYHAWEAGYEAGTRLLSLENPPSAIFATDDLMAYGVMRAAREMNRRVPEELALVGYGDVLFEQMGVPLTSISVNFQYFGRLAARLLLDVIHGFTQRDTRITIRPTLVTRETCGSNGDTRGLV